MNHDPVKFCTSCQKSKPRAGFRPVQGVVPPRFVCEDCAIKRQEAKEKAVANG